ICRASGRGCTVIPWHPAAIQVRAASTTSGIFPPRAFRSVAILLTLTLSRIIPTPRLPEPARQSSFSLPPAFPPPAHGVIFPAGLPTMILLNAAESRELDRISQQKYGISSYLLMTRAGEAVADALVERFPEAITDVLVVVGRGNNGGDGFVAARRLIQDGFGVRAVLLGRAADLKGDAARAYAEFRASGGKLIEASGESSLEAALSKRPSAVIDAIFGTGLNAEVKDGPRRAIEIVNLFAVPAIAVDIASGVNSDTGAVMGAAIRASLTVTFGFAKFGHVSYPGAGQSGELRVVDIGFAARAIEEIAPRGRFLERADVRHLIRERPANSHKGMYGHPLVIAGGRGKSGAVLLASRAALRAARAWLRRRCQS